MTKEEIDEYICKCPYFSGAKCIDRSILGTHIGSCSLEFHHKKICPSPECICAGKFGLAEPQESEDEKVIRIKKGTLKARTGRYVIYDVEWLKEHFNTTEAKLYGQPNEDCISRQAAIDALWKALHEYEDKTENQFSESKELDVADWFQHRIFVQNMSDIDRQTILNLPSVTPQPKEEPQQKIGHWEWVQYESKPNFGNWHCSECRCILCGEIKENPIRLPKYCPECGAKMQEVKK